MGKLSPSPLIRKSKKLKIIVPKTTLKKTPAPQTMVKALAIPAAGPIKLITEKGFTIIVVNKQTAR